MKIKALIITGIFLGLLSGAVFSDNNLSLSADNVDSFLQFSRLKNKFRDLKGKVISGLASCNEALPDTVFNTETFHAVMPLGDCEGDMDCAAHRAEIQANCFDKNGLRIR